MLIPPGDLQNSDPPPACRWGLGAGQERRSTPRGNLRRRPGDGDGGVGEPVRSRWASPFRLKAEGPLDAHTIKRALTFSQVLGGTGPAATLWPTAWPIANRDRPTVSHLSVNSSSPDGETVLVDRSVHPLELRPVGRAARPGRGGRQRGRPVAGGVRPGRPGAGRRGGARARGRCSSTACPTPTALAALLAGWTPGDAAAAGRAGRGGGGLRRRGPRGRRRPLGHRCRRAWWPGTARSSSSSAFCGFAPGFAYLAGLPEEYAVPRLDTPARRVPAGRSGWPARGAGSTRRPRRVAGGCSDAPTRRCGTRPQPARRCSRPGTRVRFVPA